MQQIETGSLEQSIPKETVTVPKRSSVSKKVAVTHILNCHPSSEVQNDWTFENAQSAGVLRAAPIPQRVDLREAWWGIGDQGASGSCVG